MNKAEKATKVLNYLEGLDSKAVINILNPLLDDEALEQLYYSLVRDGAIDDNDEEVEISADIKRSLEKYSDTFREGCIYVLNNLSESDKAVIRAECEKSLAMHIFPCHGIVNDSRVTDLLEEYGQDNDLPFDWYMDEYEDSDLLLLI